MGKPDIIRKLRKILEQAFLNAFGQTMEISDLSYPPEIKMGDFTLSCFTLAKKLSLPPTEIAQKLKENIPPNEIIQKVDFQGPYLNFFIQPEYLFGETLALLQDKKEDYGKSDWNNGQKILLEYLGPNTNKPLHLGHARNGAIGMAIARILETQGYEVIKTNLVNDRGIHICKSMLAWQKWGKGETPSETGEKGDHFIGRYYVLYNREVEKNPHLEEEIREMLQRWEAGDKKTRKLWKKMNDWVYEGFYETYARFGLEFDVTYYESSVYLSGKEIVQLGLEKRIFQKETDGAIYYHLSENKFGLNKNGQEKKVTLIRKDGTSLYITQDIGLAVKRFNDYHFNKMVYVVGQEQIFHFQCLFDILRQLNYSWARDLEHLPYGMVNLPDGKMKSREGKVVDTDDLISEMVRLAWEEIQKRNAKNSLPEKEIRERAEKIGLAAIKFELLRYGALQDICFDPNKSISFEGNTGPYCQYAYARIQSIRQKAKQEDVEIDDPDFSLLTTDDERALVQKIIQFPSIVEKAASSFNPSVIALHAYETAKVFNQFYATHKVVDKNNPALSSARMKLIGSIAQIIQNCLKLLGIETLDQM
jgi:arginyl-tRNA synthetase